MSRYSLLVRGGTLVTSRDTFTADVGVRDGRIAAIVAAGGLSTADAEEVVDATAKHVLPGVIDEHVHFREPGLEYKEDFLSGSRAAVLGGTTTVLDMPNTLPPISTGELVAHKQQLAEAKSYCDFGLYGLLVQDSVPELRAMADAGVVGFKCFLGRSTGDIGPPDDSRLLEGLRIIADLGLRCAFHAENDQIVQGLIRRIQEAGRTDPLAHVESRPVTAEVESIQRVGLFASTTGAKVHILHVSSRAGLATIKEWQNKGVDMTCEATPHHCLLSADEMHAIGPVMKVNPPVREAGHGAALLAGIRAGSVTSIASDHAPHARYEKLQSDIWQALSGFAGVEISLRLFLTYGGLSLQQLVRATSEGPARAWGLYPTKGALQVGADADFTLIDLDLDDVIEERRLHGKNNLTPFEGWLTRGAAVATVIRGQVVMHDGALIGPPRGRMVRVVLESKTL